MKKITAALVAILLIISCVCLSGCGFVINFFDALLGDNGDAGDNGDVGADGSDHAHQFDSYFTYSECSVAGCRVVGRKGSENKYANDFKYTLTSTKIREIDALYEQILTNIENGNNYAQFEDLYYEYLDDLDYVAHQYQVSSVLSDIKYTTTNANNYNTASKLYNEMYANFYGLYELVYDSDYRSKFYQGWSDEDIDEARYYAEIYGGSADNNNAVDDVLAEYNEFMENLDWSLSGATTAQMNSLNDLYGRLVVANNNVAKSAYYDNYMDYAYANEYHRDYTPSQVAETMRSYVKNYIAPIFINVAMTYNNLLGHGNYKFNSAADEYFYCGLMMDSLFTSTSSRNFNRVKTTIDYLGDYFEYMQMSRAATGGEKFDFHTAVEDLFKNGNYYTGEYQGAYTWWIDALDTPILYFGPDYDTAFTFVHEFGHYYQNIYNGSMNLSYDHNETHSQGNEMLFLAWLSQNKPASVTDGFELVELEQLFDMLANVVIATAVDEFEQAAYTGQYNGRSVTGSYGDLFQRILASYKGTYGGRVYNATDLLNNNYWGYVVFESAGYYISYAMSALPSLELYAKAQNDLDAARESYTKLVTFTNSSRFVATDVNGKYLKADATFASILDYCGLKGPFELGLYTTLQNYFNTRTDLK